MVGPPGSGKSMLAKRMVSILPDMSREEMMQTTEIHSVCRPHQPRAIPSWTPGPSARRTTPPRRRRSSGGAQLQPGEMSLAHNGVLFLDELPEFHRDVREALRQPIEDGVVTVSRAAGTVTYPSRFMLVCAMNPCTLRLVRPPHAALHLLGDGATALSRARVRPAARQD